MPHCAHVEANGKTVLSVAYLRQHGIMDLVVHSVMIMEQPAEVITVKCPQFRILLSYKIQRYKMNITFNSLSREGAIITVLQKSDEST
jgi:hypothetical protein